MTPTPEDPTLPFDDYFTSPEHPARPGRALYYVDHGQTHGFHFNQVSFTTRHISELLSSYAASNDVRQELDREIQDLQRQREQAENRNAQLCAEIDELQAQLREQQLGPPDDEAVQEVSKFLKAWEADSGERKLTVRLRKDGAIQFPVTALRGLLTEVSRLRAAGPPPEDADLAEATAVLAEFMKFWDRPSNHIRAVNVQSFWKGDQCPDDGYVCLTAAALRTILAELQRRQAQAARPAAAPDPLAPPVPPPPDFKAFTAELQALWDRLAASAPQVAAGLFDAATAAREGGRS